MHAMSGNISYYITHYENRLLSALCVDDRPIQASFSAAIDESGAKAVDASSFPVGTILIGRVSRIVANIKAAFVDIAPGVPGFLPFGNMQSSGNEIKQGDDILVQIERAAVKTKDPVLTMHLTISGRYVVLGHTEGGVHISNKISPKQKKRIIDFLSENGVMLPDRMPDCIIRTNASSLTDLSPVLSELTRLRTTLENLIEHAPKRTLYSVLYRPPADYLLALRDTYALSFGRIVTDIPSVFEQLTAYFTEHGDMESLQKLSFFNNKERTMSLLNFYRLGESIKEALAERVWLKSGAYLVIEPTESLTAIDVNSGKYTGKSEAEETFFKINAEAAKMIALQLRLRNLSGMILVDFISMKKQENNERLLELLRAYTADDPVHTSVIDMTPLGLVEITRKKIRKSLKEQYHETAFHD